MLTTTDVPRVALVTWCAPDSPRAGGEALRKLISRFPADRLKWASLQRPRRAEERTNDSIRAFEPRRMHWRLHGTALECVWLYGIQSRILARRIERWLTPFAPEVIWVLSELKGVPVGLHLARRMRRPVHATIHDAPELAGYSGVSRVFLPVYLAKVRSLLRTAGSVDAISDPLLAHVRGYLQDDRSLSGAVIPPSVDARFVRSDRSEPDWASPVRVVAVCGSFRVFSAQWQAFLDRLGRCVPRSLVLWFGERNALPEASFPSNVALECRGFAASEREVIDALADGRVDAGYLGVWNEPEKELFARTSLSSKLVTYCAAGLPIIADTPERSVAWDLLSRYGAGVRIGNDDSDAGLGRLLSRPDEWRQRSQGSLRLCREAFDLDRNADRMAALLRVIAKRQPRGSN